MLTFTLAVFFLLITPGPGVLSAAGFGAAHGFSKGLRYVAGLFIGTNLVALAVISGLAAVLLAQPALRIVFAILSTLYLIYLAIRIALAGKQIAFVAATAPPTIAAGLALQAINPKAYVVNTTLFAGFPIFDQVAVETIAKLLIVNAIWIPIHLVWLWAGASLHRLDLSPRIQTRVNIFMACSMLVVVALALFSGRTS